MSSTPAIGRVIRAFLIILPFGTVALGIMSFVLFFNKKEQTVQRSIKYAAGLRKDLNEADLKHYNQIVSDALTLPPAERIRTLSSFIESTLGPENMGYQIRGIMDRGEPQAPPLALDVELTGTQRPRDLVVVLCGYLPTDSITSVDLDTPRNVAAFLGVAHATTGLPKIRSLRFAAIQNLAALKAYYDDGIQAGERITHVVLLGTASKATDPEVLIPLHLEDRGVIVLRPELKGDPLPAAQSLLKTVTDLADRL